VNQRVVIPIVYVCAVFMNVMDVTIVNVALPSIGRDFHQRPAALNSVSVAYLLSLAVVIPAAGWLGARYGTKRIFLAAVAVFTISSGLCGVAPTLWTLVIARAMQGVGGGAMIPVGMAMLMLTFPPEDRVRVASILVVPTALGPALGPIVGGVLSTELSWRWVFYVNVPVGLAVLVFGWTFLIEQRERVDGSFDVWGFVLASVGFSVFMFGVSGGASHGWGSLRVAPALVLGAIIIAVLVVVETRSPHPLLALHLYRNRLFRSTSLAVLMGISALFGLLFLVPLFLQIGLGRTALQTGLDVFPEAIGVMVGGQLASRWLYMRIGPRRSVIAGLVGVGFSGLFMTAFGAGTNLWIVRSLMFALGVFMGPVYLSSQATSFATVGRADIGQASSLFNSQRQFGTAVGIALLSTVLRVAGNSGPSAGSPRSLFGYHAAFAAAGIFAFLGVGIAMKISDEDAAKTIVRRKVPVVNGSPDAEPAVAPGSVS
jgi:EmrB/QacA subfamily drug resistance transporter